MIFFLTPNIFFSDCKVGRVRFSDKFQDFGILEHFGKIRRDAKVVKTFWPDFTSLRFFSECFRISKSLKIYQRSLFDLLYNLRDKYLVVRKKLIAYFYSPK